MHDIARIGSGPRIVCWKAKEVSRDLLDCDSVDNGIHIRLIEHISPITWDNVNLNGEPVLNSGLIDA